MLHFSVNAVQNELELRRNTQINTKPGGGGGRGTAIHGLNRYVPL